MIQQVAHGDRPGRGLVSQLKLAEVSLHGRIQIDRPRFDQLLDGEGSERFGHRGDHKGGLRGDRCARPVGGSVALLVDDLVAAHDGQRQSGDRGQAHHLMDVGIDRGKLLRRGLTAPDETVRASSRKPASPTRRTRFGDMVTSGKRMFESSVARVIPNRPRCFEGGGLSKQTGFSSSGEIRRCRGSAGRTMFAVPGSRTRQRAGAACRRGRAGPAGGRAARPSCRRC